MGGGKAGKSTLRATGNLSGKTATEKSLKKQLTEPFQKPVIAGPRGSKATGGMTRDQKQYDVETEGRFINKNLTTLGRVFAILSKRKLYGKIAPPYRECKLTRLLQNSLQPENCKTLMIVNVCQNPNNVQQSKESLDFASKVMIAY